MCSRKYKTLRSVRILSKLNNISKKSLFIGFFQLKCLDSKNLTLIKSSILLSNLKTFICKNTFIQINKLLVSLFLPPLSQGSLIILYCVQSLPAHETITNIINKTNLLPLFFCIEKKLIFLKNLSLLLKNSKKEFFKLLTNILDAHNKRINSLFVTSNFCLQYLLNF